MGRNFQAGPLVQVQLPPERQGLPRRLVPQTVRTSAPLPVVGRSSTEVGRLELESWKVQPLSSGPSAAEEEDRKSDEGPEQWWSVREEESASLMAEEQWWSDELAGKLAREWAVE